MKADVILTLVKDFIKNKFATDPQIKKHFQSVYPWQNF